MIGLIVRGVQLVIHTVSFVALDFRSNRLMNEAAQRVGAQDLDGAIRCYKEVMRIELGRPRGTEAFSRVCDILTWRGVDVTQARHDYQKMVRTFERDVKDSRDTEDFAMLKLGTEAEFEALWRRLFLPPSQQPVSVGATNIGSGYTSVHNNHSTIIQSNRSELPTHDTNQIQSKSEAAPKFRCDQCGCDFEYRGRCASCGWRNVQSANPGQFSVAQYRKAGTIPIILGCVLAGFAALCVLGSILTMVDPQHPGDQTSALTGLLCTLLVLGLPAAILLLVGLRARGR